MRCYAAGQAPPGCCEKATATPLQHLPGENPACGCRLWGRDRVRQYTEFCFSKAVLQSQKVGPKKAQEVGLQCSTDAESAAPMFLGRFDARTDWKKLCREKIEFGGRRGRTDTRMPTQSLAVGAATEVSVSHYGAIIRSLMRTVYYRCSSVAVYLCSDCS